MRWRAVECFAASSSARPREQPPNPAWRVEPVLVREPDDQEPGAVERIRPCEVKSVFWRVVRAEDGDELLPLVSVAPRPAGVPEYLIPVA